MKAILILLSVFCVVACKEKKEEPKLELAANVIEASPTPIKK